MVVTTQEVAERTLRPPSKLPLNLFSIEMNREKSHICRDYIQSDAVVRADLCGIFSSVEAHLSEYSETNGNRLGRRPFLCGSLFNVWGLHAIGMSPQIRLINPSETFRLTNTKYSTNTATWFCVRNRWSKGVHERALLALFTVIFLRIDLIEWWLLTSKYCCGNLR